MALSSSLQKESGLIQTLLYFLSSPVFSLFFPAKENAISYYDSKADSDYVSTVPTAVCLH